MTTPGPGDGNDKGLAGPGGVFLDQYVLLELLSDSRRGAIYKAKHRTMGRTVAIKFLSEEAARSRQFTERFRRATKILALLEHPNLVRAHEAAEQGNTHYLVMEYIDGQDLNRLLKAEGELPMARAIDSVLQAAAGLAYAHEQGVTHRNIKPSKLVLDGQGVVKIVGFGLAQIDKEGALGQEDDAESLTIDGQVLGSYEYMAPEQAANAKNADERSDVYSLGCTLHALLTGRPPYVGKGPTMQIVAHSSQPIPSLCAACPEVPEGLDRVFKKMLAKKPEDRFASMKDVRRELESFLAKPKVAAPTPATPSRSQSSKAAATAAPAPAASPAPPASSQNKLLLGLGGGALVAVLLFLVIVFAFPGGEPSAPKPREIAKVTPPAPKPKPVEVAKVTPPSPPAKPEPGRRPTGPQTLENVLASAPPSVPPVKEPPAPTPRPPVEPKPTPSVPTPPPAVPESEPATRPEEPAPQPEPPTSPEPTPAPTEPEEPTATADARLAVPNEQARKQASVLMLDTFGAEMAEATTPEAKSQFGKRLLTIATDINDDPAGRYVILEKVTGLAMDAGDFSTGLEAIDTMANFFAIDAWTKKIDWLTTCADEAKSAEQRRAAATEAFELAKKADATSAFEIADKLCKLASSEGKKAAPFPLMKQIRIFDAEVTKRLAAFQGYEKAMAKLAADGSDRLANLDAGRYECFVIGKWDTGLAKLAASGDATLQKLAAQEQAAPSSPEQQIEVADGWHALAEKETGPTAASLHRHAGEWYEKAVPNATGLLKAKAERRLEESRAAAASAEAEQNDR
jgi:tRNA A-37 threonylcarbamoyl transferase component Bud32